MTGARARLFVAVELPDAVCARLARWARDALDERFRLIDARDLHLTVCFLGWREEGEIEAIGRVAAACARPVSGLSMREPAWLPPRRPRVVAVDLDDRDEALGALAGDVGRELAVHAGHVPEERRFRPHVTVARVRAREGLPGRARPALELPESDGPAAGAFAATALTLYRSRLSREGARYEALVRAEL